MRRRQVDSVGDVAAQQGERFFDDRIREIQLAGEARARYAQAARVDQLGRAGVGGEPDDYFRTDGAFGAPLVAVPGVVGCAVGIVARTQPLKRPRRRRVNQLAFGGAKRGTEFPLRHCLERSALCLDAIRRDYCFCSRPRGLNRRGANQ